MIAPFAGNLVPTLAPGKEHRQLIRARKLPELIAREAGIVFSPVEHEDNVQFSDDEVAQIREIVGELIGRPKTGSDGGPAGAITLKDILFVAPYNVQVRRLREALGPGARVGSVDKFQGQEADIVILSMCSSFGHYGSRGLEFILDQNRLNVALSRARILAVVVGDPRIASTPCHTIDSMRRVNLYCRLSRGLSESCAATGRNTPAART